MRVIVVYPLTNTGGVCVHEIEGDTVLASINGKDPIWCAVTEKVNDDDEWESGLVRGSFFIPFSQVMRV